MGGKEAVEKCAVLGNSNLMYCCGGQWEQAFSLEKNVKAWAHTGLSPFNQRVLWQLQEKEHRVSNVLESIKAGVTQIDWAGIRDPI